MDLDLEEAADVVVDELYAELETEPEAALARARALQAPLSEHPSVRLAVAHAIATVEGEAAACAPLEALVEDEPDYADARHSLALVTAAAPHERLVCLLSAREPRVTERFLDERGLADAGRAGDEHEPRFRSHVRDARFDLHELALAADELGDPPYRSRRRQRAGEPHRDL